MKTEFRSIIKARSGGGLFMIVASCIVIVAALGSISFAALYSNGVSTAGFAVLTVVALAGVVFLSRSVSEFNAATEWEFRANAEKICWLMRDKAGEKSEGEVYVRDIRALIYQSGDTDSGPYLQFEFRDGSIEHFPSCGLVSGARLSEFIDFWVESHCDVPIKNLKPA